MVMLLVACSGNKQESNANEEKKATAPATPIDQATVASVSGVAKLEGTAPNLEATVLKTVSLADTPPPVAKK